MPGGERGIPRSKWILPTPVPPYVPRSPKDISSETGITGPSARVSVIHRRRAELGPGRWAAVFRESARTHTR